jgi:hypothetical protein
MWNWISAELPEFRLRQARSLAYWIDVLAASSRVDPGFADADLQSPLD